MRMDNHCKRPKDPGLVEQIIYSHLEWTQYIE